jgi:hypothetical protein
LLDISGEVKEAQIPYEKDAESLRFLRTLYAWKYGTSLLTPERLPHVRSIADCTIAA